MLRERAAQVEADRRVSRETIARLEGAGLLKLTKAKRFGGLEHGPSALLRVGFELGRGCASTAWCAMIANCNAWFASYWSIEAQRDVWEAGTSSLLAGTVVPTGQCEPADGGFRISGQWPFASNCDNSDWYFVSAMLPEGQGPGWFLTPASTLAIEQESWRVAGLQGTGSKTLAAKQPVFVPAHRVVRFGDVLAGTTPGAAIPDNVLAGFGFSTFGGVALVAPLLGAAQGALDWFIEAMPAKKAAVARPGAPATAAENPFNQERAGRASAGIDAALALLSAELRASEEIILAGRPLDVDRRVRMRRSIGFGARRAVEAVNLLFDAAGASSASIDVPIQRFWRDVNAGARHVSLDDTAINTLAGQHLFGLPIAGGF
jgi:3-hydroxy-9,10-secoandrosta-1,3,5(10)-triene-9,17-dione monooxygenase